MYADTENAVKKVLENDTLLAIPVDLKSRWIYEHEFLGGPWFEQFETAVALSSIEKYGVTNNRDKQLCKEFDFEPGEEKGHTFVPLIGFPVSNGRHFGFIGVCTNIKNTNENIIDTLVEATELATILVVHELFPDRFEYIETLASDIEDVKTTTLQLNKTEFNLGRN